MIKRLPAHFYVKLAHDRYAYNSIGRRFTIAKDEVVYWTDISWPTNGSSVWTAKIKYLGTVYTLLFNDITDMQFTMLDLHQHVHASERLIRQIRAQHTINDMGNIIKSVCTEGSLRKGPIRVSLRGL